MWEVCLDPVMGVCKGRLVVWLYAVLSWACVQYRWHCVSLDEKAPLGRPLVCGLKIHQKPLLNIQLGSSTLLESEMILYINWT